MHEDPKQTGIWLGRVLQGWLNYYAVPTSYFSLQRFKWKLKFLWLRSLRRRSQKDRFPMGRLEALCNKRSGRLSASSTPGPTHALPSNTPAKSRMR